MVAAAKQVSALKHGRRMASCNEACVYLAPGQQLPFYSLMLGPMPLEQGMASRRQESPISPLHVMEAPVLRGIQWGKQPGRERGTCMGLGAASLSPGIAGAQLESRAAIRLGSGDECASLAQTVPSVWGFGTGCAAYCMGTAVTTTAPCPMAGAPAAGTGHGCNGTPQRGGNNSWQGRMGMGVFSNQAGRSKRRAGHNRASLVLRREQLHHVHGA